MLIIDRNGLQAMGTTDEVLSLGNLTSKLESFGFETIEVDGHEEDSIDIAVRSLWITGVGKPKALIARTVKGKGVPFMESDNSWHYTRLDDDTFDSAIYALGFRGETT
jgi:transketolase